MPQTAALSPGGGSLLYPDSRFPGGSQVAVHASPRVTASGVAPLSPQSRDCTLDLAAGSSSPDEIPESAAQLARCSWYSFTDVFSFIPLPSLPFFLSEGVITLKEKHRATNVLA